MSGLVVYAGRQYRPRDLPAGVSIEDTVPLADFLDGKQARQAKNKQMPPASNKTADDG